MGWRDRRARRGPEPRSKWRPGYWLRHPTFSLMVCAAVSLMFLMWAAVSGYETNRLNSHGLPAAATVLEVYDGRNSYVVARFVTAEGRTVEATVADFYWDPQPQVGDTATVIYDPDAPTDTIRDARIGSDYVTTWLAGALALVFAAGGPLYLRRNWAILTENADAWRHRRPAL